MKKVLNKITAIILIILVLLSCSGISNITVTNAQSSELISYDEMTVEVDNLQNSYKIAWVSDLHMIDNASSYLDDYAKRQTNDVNEGQRFVSEGKSRIDAITRALANRLSTGEFDAVVFGGDILDNFNDKTFEYVQDSITTNLGAYSDRVMFLYADHDYSTNLLNNGSSGGEGKVNSIFSHNINGSSLVEVLTVNKNGEQITLLGQNNSTDSSSLDSSVSIIDTYLSTSDYAFYFTHIPVDLKDSTELQKWCSTETGHQGDIYFWSKNSSRYNSVSDKYLNTLYNSSSLKGVFAGHIHTSTGRTYQFSDSAVEYVFGASGQLVDYNNKPSGIGIINIVPSGNVSTTNTSLEEAGQYIADWAISFKTNYGNKWVYNSTDFSKRAATYNSGYPSSLDAYTFDCVGCVNYILHYSIGLNYGGAETGKQGFVTPDHLVNDTTHFELHDITATDQPRAGDILIAVNSNCECYSTLSAEYKDSKNTHKHVAIYCGNGQIVDCHKSNDTQIRTVTEGDEGCTVDGDSDCIFTMFARLISLEGASFSTITGGATLPADVEEIDLDVVAAKFKYQGMPTEISSGTQKISFRWIFDKVADFADLIAGILLSCIRIPIVGLTRAVESGINSGLHGMN